MRQIYRIAAGLTPKPSNLCLNTGPQVQQSCTVTKLNSYLIC